MKGHLKNSREYLTLNPYDKGLSIINLHLRMRGKYFIFSKIEVIFYLNFI